jgi:hypothetical protein
MRYEVEWLSRVMLQGYAQSPLPPRHEALPSRPKAFSHAGLRPLTIKAQAHVPLRKKAPTPMAAARQDGRLPACKGERLCFARGGALRLGGRALNPGGPEGEGSADRGPEAGPCARRGQRRAVSVSRPVWDTSYGGRRPYSSAMEPDLFHAATVGDGQGKIKGR